MFDFVHEKRRLVQIVLVLIILPFAFFGVDSYRQSGEGKAPASVNGTEITQQEFETALRQQQDRMRQMLGANFDPAMFETTEIKRAVLDNLIAQRLLIDRAKSVGLKVTDEQVAEVIGGIDAFKEGGKFDQARYTSALANQNMSPLMFEARVRDDLVGQHQVVIKSLESNFRKLPGISGATIMGDGKVALILDVSVICLAPSRQNKLEA